MKKVCLIIFLIILFYINLPIFSDKQNTNYVKAEEPSFYMRVINDDTAIYKDKSCTQILFYLPYTYYVKILSFNEYSVFVECYINSKTPSIDGYVIKDCLFNDYTTPENPYVDLTLNTITTAVLYADLTLNNQICYIFENRNLTFYGRAKDSAENYYYFVSYNSKLGYIKENAIKPFSINNHPNPLTFIPDEPSVPSTDSPTIDSNTNINSFLTIKFIIIVCLSFAVIIALFVAFKKKEPKNYSKNYYDESDFD